MARTASQLVEELIDGVTGRDWDGLAQLYRPDAVVDQPFQLPEPARLRGRKELVEHFERAGKLPLRLQARNVVIHETRDPAIVIAEFDYEGENTATGVRFHFPNVFVVEARDGLIARTRDYSNHAVIAAAFGRLQSACTAVQEALAGPSGHGRPRG
jgi:ketosteroid isomerase-like protein